MNRIFADEICIKFSVAVVLVSLLGSCSALTDPNAATEENFRAVLEPWVSRKACAVLPMASAETLQQRGPNVKAADPYPLIGYIGYGFNFGSGKWVEGGVFAGDLGPEDAYRRLSDLGALRRTETALAYTDEEMPFGGGVSKRPHKHAIYTPVEKYNALFSFLPAETNDGQGAASRPALCFGTGKISSVQFTIPAEGQAKSSRVDYTWSAEPITEEARQLYEQDLVLIQKPPLSGSDTVVLTLTNNGWKRSGDPY